MFTRTRFAAVAAIATLGAVALAGCSGSGDPETTTDPTTDATEPTAEVTTDDADPTTDDATGGELLGSVETMFGTVEVPEPADGELTVVALGWSDAETALALGVVPVAVFDWQGFGAENKGVGPWATDLFGDVDPVIIERGDESLNYEQIQSLDPDLILNTRSGNDEAEFQRLSEIAPTVYGPAGTGAYATEWRDQVALIGDATGTSAEAADVVTDVEGAIAQAAADHPEFTGLTVASVAKFGDAYGAYLPGDGRFDILGALGFVNNPAIADQESAGFFANVSLENVSALDADVAVVLPIGYTLEETTSDALLSSLSVVADGRAVFLDPDSDLAGAWGASSPLSIPVVLDQLTPQLAAAAAAL